MPRTRLQTTNAPTAASRRSPLSRLTLCLAAGALALPLLAQPGLAQSDPPASERGVPLDQYLREQLTGEDMQKALRSFVEAFRPMAEQFDQFMKDVPQYEAPEVLPNGDILIRRKAPGDEVKT